MFGFRKNVKFPVVLVLLTYGGTRSAGEIVLDVIRTTMLRNFARRHAVGFRSCCSYVEQN